MSGETTVCEIRMRTVARRRLGQAAAVLACAFAVAFVAPGNAHAHPSRDVALTLAAPRTAGQGDDVIYVLSVRNTAHDPVSGIVVELAPPPGWDVRSAVASQGTCDGASCSLGSVSSGQTATARIVLWAASAGIFTVSATGSTTPADDNPANDTARATTVVTPSPCRLTATGTPLVAGVPRTVSARVRLGGNPVRGRRVVARGAGARASAPTNRAGVARLRLTAIRAGDVAIRVPGLAKCRTRLAVEAAPSESRPA